MRRRKFIGLIAVAGTLAALGAAEGDSCDRLSPTFPKPGSPLQDAFRQGLKDTGYLADQNVAIEYCWAEGQYERSQAMAADLVGRRVDVIAAFAPPLVRAAKNAISTIPIVFEVGNAAVKAGACFYCLHPRGTAQLESAHGCIRFT
jgi:putative tryptophan/tyrosine transport system substrate-binding protein